MEIKANNPEDAEKAAILTDMINMEICRPEPLKWKPDTWEGVPLSYMTPDEIRSKYPNPLNNNNTV